MSKRRHQGCLKPLTLKQKAKKAERNERRKRADKIKRKMRHVEKPES